MSYMFVMCIMALAQSQQGRVKTIGRPNRPGVPLEGVTVRVSGNVNAVLTKSDGTFSFPIQNQSFKFSRISKKGYELADRDFIRDNYIYSPNSPIVVAMISKADLEREREAIGESMQARLDADFKNKNAILERELEQRRITNEEFNNQLIALHEKYDNIDTLISAISDYYARMDYDNIDSLGLLINRHIESGDIEKAQQLILSLGDTDSLKQEYEKANKLHLHFQSHKDSLKKELTTRYYINYKMALSQHDYDSAYICLENRYTIDTTRVDYLFDLVLLPSNRKPRHEGYLIKLYNMVQVQDSSYLKIMMEGIIGNFYSSIRKYEQAIIFYEKMLQSIRDGKVGTEYKPLQSIGNVYRSQGLYSNTFAFYQEALKYCKKNQVYEKYRILLDVAITYYMQGEIDLALKEYMNVEKNYKSLKDSDKSIIKEMFILQGFIAKNLSERSKIKDAIIYYEKAVRSAEQYFTLSHETINIKPIMVLLKELLQVLSTQGKYRQMFNYAEKALYYAQLYVEKQPSSYSRLIYAEMLSLMAEANANMNKTSVAEKNLIECLKKSEFAGFIFKDRYQQLTYNIYNVYAIIYYKQSMYKEALNAVNKSISILPETPQAYKIKCDILNAIGEKEELKKVESFLSKTEKANRIAKDNALHDERQNIILYSMIGKDALFFAIWHYMMKSEYKYNPLQTYDNKLNKID